MNMLGRFSLTLIIFFVGLLIDKENPSIWHYIGATVSSAVFIGGGGTIK